MTAIVSPAPALRGQRQTIDPLEKISRLDAHWQPHVVAEMNDYQFKVVKVIGEFPWHRHADTDETFLVLKGRLRLELRGESGDEAVVLEAGQMAVVPKGMEHRPIAEDEVRMMLIEPRGVVNTGEVVSDRTALNDLWI